MSLVPGILNKQVETGTERPKMEDCSRNPKMIMSQIYERILNSTLSFAKNYFLKKIKTALQLCIRSVIHDS